MVENITKAYVALLSIFGFVLIAGSFKSTMNPDEKVYQPGKYTAVYNSAQESMLKEEEEEKEENIYIQQLQANIFNPQKSPNQQCH